VTAIDPFSVRLLLLSSFIEIISDTCFSPLTLIIEGIRGGGLGRKEGLLESIDLAEIKLLLDTLRLSVPLGELRC